MSFSAKFLPALLVKGRDALAEIVGAAQPAVALAFELDRQRQAGILDVVHQLFRAALRQRRKAAQLFGQRIARAQSNAASSSRFARLTARIGFGGPQFL